MSVIKPRVRGKHLVEHRTRLDQENHETLYAYAAFVDEDTDYIVNQLVETVLAKDKEFAAWRAAHPQSYAPRRLVKTQHLSRLVSARTRRLSLPSSVGANVRNPALGFSRGLSGARLLGSYATRPGATSMREMPSR